MIDLGILITGLIGFMSTIISGWVTWFFTRKKYNAEVDQTLVQNMKESLDFYRQLSDDNKSRLEEVLKRNDELEQEVKKLRDQVFIIMNQICLNSQCQVRVKNAPLHGDKQIINTNN